jgi:hypothetical protein
VSGLVIVVALVGVGTAMAFTAIEASNSAQEPPPVTGGSAQEPPVVEAPEPTVELTAEPEPQLPARPPMPAGCESLYSSAMVAQMESYGVVLNPSWAVVQLADSIPFDDPQLGEFVTALPKLECNWVSPLGGSGVGIETRVLPVTADEGAAVQARLAALGYRPLSELGGTRYFFQVDAGEQLAAYGESHIVVGGYWFATHWLELGINGYTADMVTTLLR